MLNLYTLNSAEPGDKINTYGGYGVKRIHIHSTQGSYVISGMQLPAASFWYDFEFPVLGHSLPCVFNVDSSPTTRGIITLAVCEYGGIPDVDYFDIVDLDEDGMPIYETDSVRYKKPLAEDGKSFKERVIISSPKAAKSTKVRKEK